MKTKFLFLLMLYFGLGLVVPAQNSAKLVNYHIDAYNKRDVNQQYINTQTSKITTLESNYFEDGFIIRNFDTIRCKIYLPKSKFNDDLYLYIIVRFSGDSDYVYTPKDISGYAVRNITMRAHRSLISGDTTFFFIRLIENGRVTLYDRGRIPSSNEYTYYLNRQGDKNLLIFSPNKESDFFMQESYAYSTSPMISKYRGQNEKEFSIAFSEYLKDCEGIRNKIASKFYTVKDMETIIREYNECPLAN